MVCLSATNRNTNNKQTVKLKIPLKPIYKFKDYTQEGEID